MFPQLREAGKNCLWAVVKALRRDVRRGNNGRNPMAERHLAHGQSRMPIPGPIVETWQNMCVNIHHYTHVHNSIIASFAWFVKGFDVFCR
jgi:hypothetical protein